jgi:hypothetical protein
MTGELPLARVTGYLLQNNYEESLFIDTSEIGAEWLGLANHGLMAGIGMREGSETPIDIDVIDHDGAARRKIVQASSTWRSCLLKPLM